MSKQDSYKFQSCILKVNIHCDGCEQKVKKLLQKTDGVYSVNVDAESGRVLVAGNVDPAKLIKKLKRSGKHAEIWGGHRGVNVYNQNYPLHNHFKNLQIDPSKMGKHNDSQKNWNNHQKGQQVQLSQFQNKGVKDLMLPPKGHKSVKFNLPQGDFHASDDGLDEFDDDDDELDDDFDDYDDDEEDEELGHGNPMMMPNKMNMMGGNGMGNGRGPHGPGGMMNGPGMKGKGGGMNGKKGDVIDLPIQMKGKGGMNGGSKKEKEKEKGGKQKAGNKGGDKKKGRSSGGVGLLGRFLGFGKKSKKGGGAADTTTKFKKNGVPTGSYKPKEGKKNGHDFKKIDHDFHDFDIPVKGKQGKGGKGGNGNGNSNSNNVNGMGKMGPPVGQRGGQMGPMGNNYPMEQMRNIAAVQGLPATAAMNGGYYQGMQMQMPMTMQTPHPLPYNQQQQYMAMMMNHQQQQQQQQQQANMNNMYPAGMMYGRPQGPMNYMPPPPMPSHPMADPITHVFSDENTESCTIM